MEKLGIEPMMLLTQIVNFTIMVVILAKFLYKPILRMLDERRKKIEEGLELTEKMKLTEESLQKEKEKVLDKARTEGQKIIEEYKLRAKKTEVEMLDLANAEIAGLKMKAKKEIEEERKRLVEDLNKQVLSIAISMTKTFVAQILDKKGQEELIERKLRKLEKESVHVN
jgi:F-type H+-transporting ATPase subunit b